VKTKWNGYKENETGARALSKPLRIRKTEQRILALKAIVFQGQNECEK
jgi:hypothetical protein